MYYEVGCVQTHLPGGIGIRARSAPVRHDAPYVNFFISYDEAGRQSYLIASTFEEEPFEEEAAVLRRLSTEFEMCKFGLNRIRKELDELPAETARRIAEAG
jgi:hypothetical protein